MKRAQESSRVQNGMCGSVAMTHVGSNFQFRSPTGDCRITPKRSAGRRKRQPQERQHSADAESGGTRDRLQSRDRLRRQRRRNEMTAGPEGECLRRATHDRARDRSRMAETPCGSVHESPVRGQRTRPTLEAVAPSLEYITDNSCEANAGSG